MRDKRQGTRDYCLLSDHRSSKVFSRITIPVPFILILITISCASVSVTQSNVSKSLEDIQPQWESLADGIDFYHGKISSPKMEFYVLRADLSSPNVRIFINGDSVSTKVSAFVRSNSLIAGINAAPFNEFTREGQPVKNIGLVVSEGKVYSPPANNYDALVFYRDGQRTRAIIVSQASIYSTANIENAAGGFHKILSEGQPAQRTLREEGVSAQRHPRSAAGVSANGSVLYLLVIDGRRAGSAGATERETALLLRALGCYDGLNLDGGGSSALALRYSDGSVKVVNTPSSFGMERPVAACIGISLSKER